MLAPALIRFIEAYKTFCRYVSPKQLLKYISGGKQFIPAKDICRLQEKRFIPELYPSQAGLFGRRQGMKSLRGRERSLQINS